MSSVKPLEGEKEKASSSIVLTAIASFTEPKNGGFDLDVHYGASRGVIADDGRRYLEMSNVPFGRQGLKAPEGGLLLLYGFRDKLDEMRKRRADARKIGAEFHYCDVEVDVGIAVPAGQVDRSLLNGRCFANLNRMSADLQKDILAAFSSYVNEEGGDAAKEMSKIRQIAQRPDLFCRLMDEDPDMKSLKVLVIPVAEDPEFPARVRQLAYVRQGANLLKFDQNEELNVLVLPKWFSTPRKTVDGRASKQSSSLSA